MKTRILLPLVLLLAAGHPPLRGADAVFSGPQPGEKTTSFKTLELPAKGELREFDPIAANAGAPTALVFVHTIERSLVPLLRVIDQYGAERRDRIRTEVVFLSPDRLAGEQRVRAAAGSLKLQSRVSLSPDGVEGPGNYGLNKECMMTVVAARENRVTANFALVQPGIADAPKVLEALARVCGDTNAPTVEQLNERQMARSGGGRERGGGMEMERGRAGEGTRPKEKFPGAVPTDGKLNQLIRQIIRPTNDVATVDRLLAEMDAHVRGNADLRRQAIDAWVRVLHFGDRYGTAHARTAGTAFMERLRKEDGAGPRAQ